MAQPPAPLGPLSAPTLTPLCFGEPFATAASMPIGFPDYQHIL